MPGTDEKSTGLQKPSDTKKPVDEPVIHVIPESFYGAGLKTKAPPLQPVTPPPGTPVPPVVPAGAAAPVPPKRKSRSGLLVIVGIFLLLAIAGAAYFLTRPAPTVPIANVNETPRIVCGDAKCDAPSETSANCSADCGAPAPLCGDAKCDVPTETSQNCPADCGVAAVCGDNKCDVTETVDTCPADCKPPEPKPGEDRDSDGLSDQEEREVFGTDPSSPNTDRDSFVDLNEALNLFDPALPSPALLKDSKMIVVYKNATQHFSMFRPAAWTVTEAPEDNELITFSAPSGESVTAMISAKPAAQALMDWYLAQAPGVTSSQVEPYKTRNGFDAILSPDRLSAYVDFGDHVIVVRYDLNKQLDIQYRVTFQMMVQSLSRI